MFNPKAGKCQNSLLLFLGVTVEPPRTNVYALETHIINCILTDIFAQIIGVNWTTPTSTTNTDGYTLRDGVFNQEKKYQVSTLTIATTQLLKLRSSVESHTFTCKITAGANKTIADFQIITIFDPSKIFWMSS